ncbi:hypothetical protein TIFTF001_055576, partial [Ficus carica]
KPRSTAILERLEKLESKLGSLEIGLKELTAEVTQNRPLTSQEVKTLVQEIAKQPKLVEEEALRISEELENYSLIIT